MHHTTSMEMKFCTSYNVPIVFHFYEKKYFFDNTKCYMFALAVEMQPYKIDPKMALTQADNIFHRNNALNL